MTDEQRRDYNVNINWNFPNWIKWSLSVVLGGVISALLAGSILLWSEVLRTWHQEH